MRKQKNHKATKYKFSKKIVLSCIVFIVFYTMLQLYLSYKLQIELSPTLTTSVYAFFGTELVATALLKIFDKEIDSIDPTTSDDEI